MDKGPWWHSRQMSQWGSILNSDRFKLWTLQTLRREVRLLNSWPSALSGRWELTKTKDSSFTVTAFISWSDMTSLASFVVATSFTLKKKKKLNKIKINNEKSKQGYLVRTPKFVQRIYVVKMITSIFQSFAHLKRGRHNLYKRSFEEEAWGRCSPLCPAV